MTIHDQVAELKESLRKALERAEAELLANSGATSVHSVFDTFREELGL